MITIVWVVIGVVFLLSVGFMLLWIRAIRATERRNEQLDNELLPVLAAVQANDPAAPQLVYDAAKTPSTRNFLYSRLNDLNRIDLFPEEFRTEEKYAESDLVQWLMHPNELNAAPAEIQLVRRVAVEEGDRKGTLYLFRFLTDSTHGAWERGWMAGVSGVYWEGAGLEEGARDTFSEFMPFNQMTEEQHVEVLRNALNKKGLVVRS